MRHAHLLLRARRSSREDRALGSRSPVHGTSALLLALLLLLGGCSGPASEPVSDATSTDGDEADVLPSILLVTLDTTRADSVELDADDSPAPALRALARRGVVFDQAYAPAPMTLPSHTSMLTGLYPIDHGIHENGRFVDPGQALLAERLSEHGYSSAAFVSGFPLSAQFGIAQGFDHYDDELGGVVERLAEPTTDRAIAWLAEAPGGPLFVWVHYFDPHAPYEPPEPFASRHADPYDGEIASMDHQLGRLVEAFEAQSGTRPTRVLVVGDHGESLGEHGEMQHGNLLYQGVMRVPLVIAGSGIEPARRDDAASVRRVFDTVLDWAGLERGDGEATVSLLGPEDDAPVLGEALKPWLQYGWQPQVMAVAGELKMIRSGNRSTEVYDVRADPEESRDLAGEASLPAEIVAAVERYLERALEQAGATAASELDADTRQSLAALGYVAPGEARTLRDDAPIPREMAHLFDDLDRGSKLFVDADYERAIPVFASILEQDPGNLMVAVRIAVSHSLLGNVEQAQRFFDRAAAIDPSSVDLQHYQAMHFFRSGDWQRAEPLFETVLAAMPNRLAALEALSRIRERQGRIDEAAALAERAIEQRPRSTVELARLGNLRMMMGDTVGAIEAFERSRALAGDDFRQDLELGVLYLADRRFEEARDALDRVPSSHPGYPMALFKRAQVAVLLDEPEQRQWIDRARAAADDVTGPLIANEPLFREPGQR